MAPAIRVDRDRVAQFCRKWKIAELSLFGSVLRPDFQAESDVDVLVRFAPDADVGLLDHMAMQEELSAILGRPVDLVSRRAVERRALTVAARSVSRRELSRMAAQRFTRAPVGSGRSSCRRSSGAVITSAFR